MDPFVNLLVTKRESGEIEHNLPGIADILGVQVREIGAQLIRDNRRSSPS